MTDVIVYIDKDETPTVLAANKLSVTLAYEQEDGSYTALDYFEADKTTEPVNETATSLDMTVREIAIKQRYYMTYWTVDDVMECDPDNKLDLNDCYRVLLDIMNNYESEHGVNWADIEQNTHDMIVSKKDEIK
jgi:hypothetical protein